MTTLFTTTEEETRIGSCDIKLTILGEPLAQQRHRSTLRLKAGVIGIEISWLNWQIIPTVIWEKIRKKTKLYAKDDFFIMNYDPSAKDKATIRRLVEAEAPAIPFEGPLRVDLLFYFTYLKGHYRTGKYRGQLKANAPIWKDTGKDIDNCDKIYLDVMTGTFFKNDSQVCFGMRLKRYSERPRTEIYITRL